MFMMIQMVPSHEPHPSWIVLKHSPHIEKDRSYESRFPIRLCNQQRRKESDALKNPFPSAFVIRVAPRGKPILVVSFVHPVQGRRVKSNVGRKKPNIIRNNVGEDAPHFAFKQMGASQSQADRVRFSSLPRGMTVEGDEAFLDMPDGSRRLIAVRGGALHGGRDLVPRSPPRPRESFEAMWLRMVNDSATEFALPLPDEAFAVVEQYYNEHPNAPYDSVRGFGMALLPRYGERLPKALRLLMFQNELSFFEYQAELDRFQAELTATGRPEPFAIFPADSYARWEAFIARADAIKESLIQMGIPLPPMV